MSLTSLWPFVLTGLTVSVLHAALPTHWLPFVLAGRSQKWSYRQVLSVLTIAGVGHILMTSFIGAGLVWFGLHLHENFQHGLVLVAVASVFSFGVYNIWQHYKGIRHSHCNHHHPHHHDHDRGSRDGWATLSLLSLLTLSPCHSFIPIYISAWTTGWAGFYILTLVLAVGTLASMFILTSLAFLGLQKLKMRWVEDYEKLLTGCLLLLLSVFIYFAESAHHALH